MNITNAFGVIFVANCQHVHSCEFFPDRKEEPYLLKTEKFMSLSFSLYSAFSKFTAQN